MASEDTPSPIEVARQSLNALRAALQTIIAVEVQMKAATESMEVSLASLADTLSGESLPDEDKVKLADVVEPLLDSDPTTEALDIAIASFESAFGPPDDVDAEPAEVAASKDDFGGRIKELNAEDRDEVEDEIEDNAGKKAGEKTVGESVSISGNRWTVHSAQKKDGDWTYNLFDPDSGKMMYNARPESWTAVEAKVAKIIIEARGKTLAMDGKFLNGMRHGVLVAGRNGEPVVLKSRRMVVLDNEDGKAPLDTVEASAKNTSRLLWAVVKK